MRSHSHTHTNTIINSCIPAPICTQRNKLVIWHQQRFLLVPAALALCTLSEPFPQRLLEPNHLHASVGQIKVKVDNSIHFLFLSLSQRFAAYPISIAGTYQCFPSSVLFFLCFLSFFEPHPAPPLLIWNWMLILALKTVEWWRVSGISSSAVCTTSIPFWSF